MRIQFFLFFFIIFIGYIYNCLGDNEENRKQYIIIILSLLIGESCLRGLSVGSDTLAYHWWFEYYEDMEWNRIFTNFVNRYIYFQINDDIGFGIYMKLVHIFSHNFSFFLFISALFFFIPFGILLYKYTDKIQQLTFVFVLYVSLFNPIAMSGVRKEISLGFAIVAFLFYVEKKYIYSIIILLIGATIHESILLVLLVPILDLFSGKWIFISHVISFFLIPFIIYSSGTLLLMMGGIAKNERYQKYGLQEAQGGAWTFFIFIELISLFCLISFCKKILKDDNTFFKKLYIMLPLFTIFAPLIKHSGSMIRISQYFHIYIVLLIPYAIDIYFNKNNRKYIYIALIVLLISMSYMAGWSNYTFIWQDNIPIYKYY